MINKDKKGRVTIIFLYLLLLFPNFYSIYYSVPASDDFAMTLGRDAYPNILSEFLACVQFFWMKRGGTIIGFIVEVLINPLNAHIHLGHLYGIYMIIAFVVCFSAVLYGISTIVKYLIANSTLADKYASVITFLIAFMLLENYYYVETYNWYVGMIAYPFSMAFLFLTFAFIIKYAQTGDNKFYNGMIITGIIAANTTALDVSLGVFFLYIVVLKKGFNNHIKSTLKKFAPLIIYVIVGIITLAAPGNYARQSQYTEAVSITTSVKQTIADVLFFGASIVKERPVTLVVLTLLFFVGMYINSSNKQRPGNLILYIIATVVVWIGCILPYVYGRGMTRTYLDVRMQYVLDYFIEIGLCVGVLLFGQWVSYVVKIDLEKVSKVAIVAVAILGAMGLVITGRYVSTVTYDVYAHRAEIKNSYILWDGILSEIENSPDSKVVVDRDWNVPWNKYFLYSGLEPGEEYAVALDSFYDSLQILPNVYYKKDSIVVNYPR